MHENVAYKSATSFSLVKKKVFEMSLSCGLSSITVGQVLAELLEFSHAGS